MGDDEFLRFHRPTLGDDEERAVVDVLRSGWLTTGSRTKELEARFAAYRSCGRAVGTNSCTAALHLALLALGIGAGDDVVTSPITFPSTANVIIHCGATPVFCDVQEDTLNIDPEALAAALTPRTRAVIVVHFAGHPCDMDEILAICDARGIAVIEDAAHAVEAEYRGRPTGSLGRVAAFSFYATKNITSGEGGMLTTNDAALADKAQILGLHGISRDAWKRYGDEGYKHWEVVAPGYKYNMSDLQAALVNVQLDRIDEFWRRRAALSRLYDEGLRDVLGVDPLSRRPYVRAAYHLYVVRVRPEAGLPRDDFLDALFARGIGAGVHFRAVHLQPYYAETYGHRRGLLPRAEAGGDAVVSLPLYPSLRERDVARVVEACRSVVRPA